MKKQQFIPQAKMKKMQHYLIELNSQAGSGRIGGSTLRKEVIEKVATKMGDRKPPSPAKLARWVTLQLIGQLK
jgi:hypothetical protein